MSDTVKGSVIRREFSDGIRLLSREQKGALMEAILDDMDGVETGGLDEVTRVVWTMMRPSIHAGHQAFAQKQECARTNGRSGGRTARASGGKTDSVTENRVGSEKTDSVIENRVGSGETKTLNRIDRNRIDQNGMDQNGGDGINARAREGAGAPAANTGTKGERSRFLPPSVAEIEACCRENGYTVDAQRFHDYYAAQGWELSNGRKMRDWQAAVRNWEMRDRTKAQEQTYPPGRTRLSEADERQEHNNAVCAQVLAELRAGDNSPW